MAELSRDGHRQRTKTAYLNNGANSMADHNLLEMLLFYAIPRKDVKPIAYSLINHFGTIEAVFNASIDELMQVDGIGENAAILINLNKSISERIAVNKNNDIKVIDNYKTAIEFANNALKESPIEKVLLVTLNNKSEVIKSRIIATGGINQAAPNKGDVIKAALNDKASAVIIAHNHPNGLPIPSEPDLDYTLAIRDLLVQIGVVLNDHVIVGADKTRCMSTLVGYSQYFDVEKNTKVINSITKEFTE